MNGEQLREEFEVWAANKWPGANFSPDQNNCGIVVPERYKHPKLQVAWEAYQAGRAALQHSCKEKSLDWEDAERYRWLKIGANPSQIQDLMTQMQAAFHLVKAYEVFCTSWTKWDAAIDHARRVEGENK